MINELEKKIISCILKDNSLFVQYRNQLLEDAFANPVYKTLISFFNSNITNKITHEIAEVNLNAKIEIDSKADLTSFSAFLHSFLSNYKQTLIERAMADFYASVGVVSQEELINSFKKKIEDIDVLINNQQCAFRADRDWLLNNAADIMSEESDKIKTGYTAIDDVLEGGFELGNLITISANSGAGKTTWGLNLYLRMLEESNSGIFFSTEMTEKEMAKRIYRTYAERYIGGKNGFTHDDIEKIYIKFSRSKGHNVIVEPRLNTGIIRREVLAAKKTGINFIVVDNLNRMQLPNLKNKFDAYSAVVKELKNLALEENIVVILLAQSTAENMKSAKNKRLTLADLAGSQDISRESNYVFMMHREAYFRQQGGMIGEEIPQAIKYITEVSCVKAREHNPFNFCLKFYGGALKEATEIEVSEYLAALRNDKNKF